MGKNSLEEPPITTIGITRVALEEGFNELLRTDGDLQNKKSDLIERSSQVSFQQLFNAIEALGRAKCQIAARPVTLHYRANMSFFTTLTKKPKLD